MDIKSLMHADYLDIVFDNRNKNYGGYELRRHYSGRVGKAAAILYSALAALVLFIVFRAPAELPQIVPPVYHPMEPTLFDRTVVAPPKPVEPPRPKTSTNAHPTFPPVISRDPIPDPEPIAPTTGSGASAGTGVGIDSTDVGIGMENTGGGKGITPPVKMEPELPRKFAEVMPSFDGDMYDYLSKNVHYPDEARNANIEGKVVIQFVVNEDGAVTNAAVVRKIGGGCDEEALRVVSAMPKWKPGKQNGKAVKVFFSVAVNYVLQ
jgi:periplasmic protein TonB